MHIFDSHATTESINSVYTTEIHLDYEQVLGFSPETISSETWAKRLNHIHEPYDEMQHIIQLSLAPVSLVLHTMGLIRPPHNSNILIDIPQPTGSTSSKRPTRPDRCQASAYAHGLFYNRDTDKRPCVMAKRQGVSLRLR